ncbi:MAG: hypothetical protein ABEJ58_11095 [Halodesulfurarchaeum sp.]
MSFDEYVVWSHAVAWGVFVVTAVGTVPVSGQLIETLFRSLLAVLDVSTALQIPWVTDVVHLVVSVSAGLLGRSGTLLASKWFLRSVARRRRIGIERTLPGAVRYLHVVAAGTVDPSGMFEAVAAKTEIHGECARSFERIIAVAEVRESIDDAIRHVASETPAQDSLAPFLLSFLARKRSGPDALRDFLASESRLLAIQDEQAHLRERRYRSIVIELFLLILVLPLLGVVAVIGVSIAIPHFGLQAVTVPEWAAGTDRLFLVGGVLVLFFGLLSSLFAYRLRPIGLRWAAPAPSSRPIDVLRHAWLNPANTVRVLAPLGLGSVAIMVVSGIEMGIGLLLAYGVVAVLVGLVDVRRDRLRRSMDRRLPAFVDAVSRTLDRGIPFAGAVHRVARRQDFGTLQGPISKLAFDLRTATADGPVRIRALERFIGRIGTPFAGRTVGLAVGALEAGSDARTAFRALQVETGRLAHGEHARHARRPTVVLVGWTGALFVVSMVGILNLLAVETLGPIGGVTVAGVHLEPTLPVASRVNPRVYYLTQVVMLVSGWFAGFTGRGRYEALLHSGGLSLLSTGVFLAFGLI